MLPDESTLRQIARWDKATGQPLMELDSRIRTQVILGASIRREWVNLADHPWDSSASLSLDHLIAKESGAEDHASRAMDQLLVSIGSILARRQSRPVSSLLTSRRDHGELNSGDQASELEGDCGMQESLALLGRSIIGWRRSLWTFAKASRNLMPDGRDQDRLTLLDAEMGRQSHNFTHIWKAFTDVRTVTRDGTKILTTADKSPTEDETAASLNRLDPVSEESTRLINKMRFDLAAGHYGTHPKVWNRYAIGNTESEPTRRAADSGEADPAPVLQHTSATPDITLHHENRKVHRMQRNVMLALGVAIAWGITLTFGESDPLKSDRENSPSTDISRMSDQSSEQVEKSWMAQSDRRL